MAPVAMLAMAIAPSEARAQLEFDLTATITSNYPNLAAGRTDQYSWIGEGVPGYSFAGPAFAPSGRITNYSASLGPSVTTDLDRYRLNASFLVSRFDPNTRTATYTGNYGIFYNASGLDSVTGAPAADYLEFGTLDFAAVFAPDYSTAAVTGTLVPQPGSLTPPGFPGPIDYADKYRPGTFAGTFTSSSNVLTGTVRAEVIPEPATFALVASGLLPVAGVMLLRRRRT
jgi:hypothetical protein